MKSKLIHDGQRLNTQITLMIEAQEYWRSVAERSTSELSHMPRNKPSENTQENALCMVVEIGVLIDRLVDELCEVRGRIKEYIKTTGDNDEKLLEILRIEE